LFFNVRIATKDNHFVLYGVWNQGKEDLLKDGVLDLENWQLLLHYGWPS